MLPQASSMCRIGNSLRGSRSKNPIVIMAIYVDNRFRAIQHLLYQPGVRFTEVVFNRLTGSQWLISSSSSPHQNQTIMVFVYLGSGWQRRRIRWPEKIILPFRQQGKNAKRATMTLVALAIH